MKNLIVTLCLVLVCWYEFDYFTDSKGQIQIEKNIYCDEYSTGSFCIDESIYIQSTPHTK